MTLKADPVFIEVPVPIGTLVLSKHLSGQHDQKTHGKGGIHSGGARRDFWKTEESPSELKKAVAKKLAARMESKGITKEELSKLFLENYNATPKWDGKKDLGDIYALVIAGQTVRETSMVSLYRLASDQIDIPFGTELTYDEAVAILDKVNARVKLNYTFDASGFDFSEQAVSNMVAQWADTSNNRSPRSLAIQDVAKETFKLKNTADWDANEEWIPEQKQNLISKNGKIYKAFLESQYEETQAFLKSKGIKEITVYRGTTQDLLGQNAGIQKVATVTRPLSSWSTSLATAMVFSGGRGTVLRKVVSAKDILATPFTGVGCYDERELVLLGSKETVDGATSWDSVDLGEAEVSDS